MVELARFQVGARGDGLFDHELGVWPAILDDFRGGALDAGIEQMQVAGKLLVIAVSDVEGLGVREAVTIEGEPPEAPQGARVLILVADRVSEAFALDMDSFSGELLMGADEAVMLIERVESTGRESAAATQAGTGRYVRHAGELNAGRLSVANDLPE